ncbi:porin family protein [Flavobacterium sp.]|uniref:porin family protein n=1 Tax=Flavobacterium sp. TaxID=239 RepID=UPI00286C49CA|nr:porin family protein [Flavobacterium sp.]
MKNSKLIIALTLFMGLTQLSNAQTDNAKVGIKGGVNFSNLYTDDVDDNNVLTGFNVGLFAKIPVTEMFAIQPELNYSTKGAKLTYNNTFAKGTAKFNLGYIEIPVLAVVNITENFNIHAGPYAGYLLSANVKNDANNNSYDFENNFEAEDFNRFDVGASVGLGLDLDSFSVGARYNYGLTNIGKERTFLGTSYTFPDAKNSVINIYAAFSFN